MASTFIAVNHRDGSGPVLKAYTNGTPTILGTTFGAADGMGGYGPDTEFMNNAQFCYFLGFFYALVGGKIYKATDLTATSWTLVLTINVSNLATTIQAVHSGLQVVFNAGVPMMVVIYLASTSKTAVWSADGSVWTETPSITTAAGYAQFNTPMLYHGKLYTYLYNTISNTSGSWVIFDPASKTLSTFAMTFASSDMAAAMTVCQDRIFHQQISGTTITLYELSGASAVARATIRSGATPMAKDGKSVIWSDGGFLYSMYWVSAGVGWEVKQITLDTWSMTDETSTMIPVEMAGVSSPPNTGRVGMLTDGVASPGSTPGRFIYYAHDGGTATAWSVYKLNGISAMVFLDSGGLASDAMPFYTQVDGDVFFSSGQKKIELISRTAVPGGVRYSFKIWGASETVSVRGWYCPATGDFPDTAATLSNPSVGVLSGNTVIGLTADGITTVQLTWLAATDGFATGDFPKFLLEQF